MVLVGLCSWTPLRLSALSRLRVLEQLKEGVGPREVPTGALDGWGAGPQKVCGPARPARAGAHRLEQGWAGEMCRGQGFGLAVGLG